MNGRAYPFLFSVVMPIYNVEDYLDEAVESVISQSIGFEENIQLIMVDDGSPDGSAAICRRYAELYPDNVVFIEKENGGVSSARNAGIPHLKGRYVNFMDPDDVWDRDAFRSAAEFFEANPEVKLASARMLFLDRDSSYHLDYEYDRTRVVDIDEEYDCPILSVARSFIEYPLVCGELFDEELSVSEDLLYINRIVLDAGSYGLLREAVYYYRKRDEGSSALDLSSRNITYYTITPEKALKGIARYSIEKKGFVHKYIQYLLITDMQWRLFSILPEDVLDEEQLEGYRASLREVMGYIDDDIIASQRRMSLREKVYAAKLKNGEEAFDADAECRQIMLGQVKLSVRLIRQEGDRLVVEGLATEKYVSPEAHLYAADSKGRRIEASYKRSTAFDRTGIDPGIRQESRAYVLELPLRDGEKYSFYLSGGGAADRKLKTSYGKFSRLNNYRGAFFVTGGWLIRKEGDRLSVERNSVIREKLAAYRYLKRLSELDDRSVAELWKKAYALRRKKKRPIWIVSDRSHIAGDSGEVMFRYFLENGYDRTRDIYFLLEEDSADLERISSIGRVLRYGSDEHLVKQMAADMIISSHADNWVIIPYREPKFFRCFQDQKFVFLQHGVIQGDMSEWLYRLNKDIKLFITSAKTEYDSIANDRYDYDASVVKMTGLARHDLLKDDKQKLIAIAPTWRKAIAGRELDGSRKSYMESFRDTEYFRFYDSLINDERLLDAMRCGGYRGMLYLHPAVIAQARDFRANDVIGVCEGNFDYPKVFRESALFVTDYSSAAMDFAILKKPVIYTQFDRDDFFRYHLYERGIFDYERDGFGPVCYNYEDTVSAMSGYIDSGCAEPETYSKRVDAFFAHTDGHNRERIAAEIVRLEKEQS